MALKFDKEKCTGCGSCESACPFGLIAIVDDKPASKWRAVTSAAPVRDACAAEAIKIEKEMAQTPIDGEHHGVWVFAEQRNGEIKGVGLELLSKGRELADTLQTELCAVCLGHDIKGVEQFSVCGADKIYLIDDPAFANQSEDPYVAETCPAGKNL